MKRSKILLIPLLLAVVMVILSCSSLPYSDDVGFLVSAQANSPEAPIYLNGAACKDMDGNPGLCSKRIRSTDTLVIHFDPLSYGYNLQVSCSSPIVVPGATVPAGQPFDLSITPAQMAGRLSFICIGEIFPQDRTQPSSSKWEIRIVVSDVNYVSREQMNLIRKGNTDYLILGKYARTSWVYDGKSWKQYKKKTIVPLKDASKAMAMSESYSSRWNYYNWSTPVVAGRSGD